MKTIDPATAELTLGMMNVIECIIVSLESNGSLNRDALVYMAENRLRALPDDELRSLPLALLMKFLRPESPPLPTLKLIPGGKNP